MWKTNKVPELAPSTLGHRRPFEYRRVPHLGLFLSWILEVGASPRWEFSLKLEKRGDTGETSPSNDLPPLYCSSRPFMLLIIHRDQWVIQSYAALAAQTLIKIRLFSLHTSLRWFTSSSGQKGQLTFYSLFSDKGLSTRRLICVDLPKVWCHSQKVLNKVTFLHSKDTRGVQWYITKEE